MKLREMATAWLEANCPGIDVRQDFQQNFDRALQRNATCSFVLGSRLTRGRKPYLIYCFGGEFFAFALTPRQVARLGVQDNEMRCAEGPSHEVREPTVEPFVLIEQVKVDDADSLSRLQPITGTLQYRAKQVQLAPVAIKVDCEPPGRGRLSLYHHLSCLVPMEGNVKFSLLQLGDFLDAGGNQFASVLPLFFQIWTAPPPLPAPQGSQHSVASEMNLAWPAIPPAIAPTIPVGSPYPPASNAGASPSQTFDSRPISDIRAVLVEIS